MGRAQEGGGGEGRQVREGTRVWACVAQERGERGGRVGERRESQAVGAMKESCGRLAGSLEA